MSPHDNERQNFTHQHEHLHDGEGRWLFIDYRLEDRDEGDDGTEQQKDPHEHETHQNTPIQRRNSQTHGTTASKIHHHDHAAKHLAPVIFMMKKINVHGNSDPLDSEVLLMLLLDRERDRFDE